MNRQMIHRWKTETIWTFWHHLSGLQKELKSLPRLIQDGCFILLNSSFACKPKNWVMHYKIFAVNILILLALNWMILESHFSLFDSMFKIKNVKSGFLLCRYVIKNTWLVFIGLSRKLFPDYFLVTGVVQDNFNIEV